MPCCLVVGHLFGAAAVGFVDGFAHRVGDAVGIQNGGAVQVARGAAYGLDQRAFGTQEAFLVRIQDRHQRHFGNIQPLAQQVDADQHVEHAEAQVADDLHALHGLDVRVQVAHLDAVLGEVFGQIFRHALGQRGDQHAFAHVRAQSHFGHQVVHLVGGGTHFDGRVDQAGRAHHLLHHLPGVLGFVGGRRGGDEDASGA